MKMTKPSLLGNPPSLPGCQITDYRMISGRFLFIHANDHEGLSICDVKVWALDKVIKDVLLPMENNPSYARNSVWWDPWASGEKRWVVGLHWPGLQEGDFWGPGHYNGVPAFEPQKPSHKVITFAIKHGDGKSFGGAEPAEFDSSWAGFRIRINQDGSNEFCLKWNHFGKREHNVRTFA